MKKIQIIILSILIICIVVFYIASTTASTNATKFTSYKVNWSDLDCQHQLYFTQKFLSIMLAPYMQGEINNYYGELRQYTNFEITEIKIINYDNYITVEVLSFTGAHNPPYGKEIFKFQIGYDNECRIKLIEYKHEDIKSN